MEKIIIFGTGARSEKVLQNFDDKKYNLVAYLDNNIEKQGKILNGTIIKVPNDLKDLIFDKIIICSTSYDAIYNQLIKDHNVDPNKIENSLYFIKRMIIEYYESQSEKDTEIKEIIDFIRKNNLQIFNYDFCKKYEDMEVDVRFDDNVNMFYVLHNDKKMYFKESYKNKEDVVFYYKFISQEQDLASPHRYLTETMKVEKGDIVVDAGVAEGNFALDVIDDVSKIYLIEMDHDWVNALKETFKEYGDKVVFVDKYLSDFDDSDNVSLDKLIGDKEVNFIKMDIEGGEVKALHGANNILSQNGRLKLDICAYHNNSDEQKLKEILYKYKFEISTSRGYMFYGTEGMNQMHSNKEPRLVRGLIRSIRSV